MNWNFKEYWTWLAAEFLAEGSALGVYLDGAGLVLAQVQKGFSGLEVKHLASLPLGPGKLKDLAPRLRETLSAWGPESGPVGLAVSRSLGFFRKVTLPKAAVENLSQVVAYEMDRFLPLPADELYFDFQVLEESDKEIHLMLMALPRAPVLECLDLLAEAGLRPAWLELAPTAAANTFAMLGGRLPASWLQLRLERDSLELTHIEGKLVWSCTQMSLAPSRNLSETLGPEIDRLTHEGHSPKALCFYGRRLPGLDIAALSQKRGLAFVSPELFPLAGLPLETDMVQVLPALGAALRGLGKAPLGANLLPAEERPLAHPARFSRNRLLLATFSVFLCLLLGSLLIHKRVELYQVNRQLARMGPEVRQIERQLEESRALAKQLEGFRRIEQSPDKLRTLQKLTQLIPDHTWLFHLRLSQQTLEISGMSRSAADLIPLLEKSGWLTKTEFASPIVTDAQTKLEHFKIKTEIKGLEPGS